MTDDLSDDDRTVFRPTPGKTGGLVDTGRTAPPGNDGGSVDPDGAALPMGSFLGEFELKAVVGEGGFGIVYLAWDHSLQRRVALKEYIPPALATRAGGTQVHVRSQRQHETFVLGLNSFVNEARLLARFEHRSLVKVYRFWEANGTAYMVMPYYEGETLAARLARLGEPPGEDWLISILDPVSSALATLHREQCFHRDVAPDNIILLAGSDLPVLLDFGAARQVIGDAAQALTVILKPGYAPVEQYAEVPCMKQGPWTDVYALAATVAFAITGERPRPAVARLMHDDDAPLARSCAGRYSAPFLRALDAALRVRPEERTQSIADLRRDLGLPAASEAAEATTRGSGSLPPPAAAAGRRHRGRTAAIAVGTLSALVMAGAMAAWLLAGHEDTAAQTTTTPPPPVPRIVPAAPLPPPVAIVPPMHQTPQPTDVRGQFQFAVQHQTADFAVQVHAERPRLQIDRDDLRFRVRSSRDGYLTLLAYGPDGSLTQLLPNPTLGSPRVGAGKEVVLPSTGRISIGEPAGTEHLLVLVSASPRDFTALGATSSRDGYVEFPKEAELAGRIAQWSGAGPALLGAASGCAAPSPCEDYAAATFDVTVVR